MSETNTKTEVTKGSTGARWTASEDNGLRIAVARQRADAQQEVVAAGIPYSTADVKIDWEKVAAHVGGGGTRTPKQCEVRWERVVSKGWIKGPWTPEEDEMILKCIAQNITKWSDIAACIPGRVGKQCRERYHNHLDPSINKGPWTPEEDAILLKAVEELGTRWTIIAQQLKGRSENTVKNRWNSIIRRRNFNNTPFQSQTLGKLLMNAKRAVSNRRAQAVKTSSGPGKDGDVSSKEYNSDSSQGTRPRRTRGKRNRRQMEDAESDDEFILPGGAGTVTTPRRSTRAAARQAASRYTSDLDSTTDEEEDESMYISQMPGNSEDEDYGSTQAKQDTHTMKAEMTNSMATSVTQTPNASLPTSSSNTPNSQYTHASTVLGQSTAPMQYTTSQHPGATERYPHSHSPTGGEPIGFTHPTQGTTQPQGHPSGQSNTPSPQGYPTQSPHSHQQQPRDTMYNMQHMHPNLYGVGPHAQMHQQQTQQQQRMYPSTFPVSGNAGHDKPATTATTASTATATATTSNRPGTSPDEPSFHEPQLGPAQSRYLPVRELTPYPRSDYNMIMPHRTDTPGAVHPSSDWPHDPALVSSMTYPGAYLGGYSGPKHHYSMKPMHYPPQGPPNVIPEGLGTPNMYGAEHMFQHNGPSMHPGSYLGNNVYPQGYIPLQPRMAPPLPRPPPKGSSEMHGGYMPPMSVAHSPQRPLSRSSSQISTVLPAHFPPGSQHHPEHAGNSYKLGDSTVTGDYLKDRPYGLHPSYANLSRQPSPLSSRIPSPTASPTRPSHGYNATNASVPSSQDTKTHDDTGDAPQSTKESATTTTSTSPTGVTSDATTDPARANMTHPHPSGQATHTIMGASADNPNTALYTGVASNASADQNPPTVASIQTNETTTTMNNASEHTATSNDAAETNVPSQAATTAQSQIQASTHTSPAESETDANADTTSGNTSATSAEMTTNVPGTSEDANNVTQQSTALMNKTTSTGSIKTVTDQQQQGGPEAESAASGSHAKSKTGDTPHNKNSNKPMRPNVDLTLLPAAPFDAHTRWPTALEPPAVMNQFMSAYSPLSANTPISFSRPASPAIPLKSDKTQRLPHIHPAGVHGQGFSRPAYPYAYTNSPRMDEHYPGLEQPYNTHPPVSPAHGMAEGFHLPNHHGSMDVRDIHRPHGNAYGFPSFPVDRTISPYPPPQPHPLGHYPPNHGPGMYRYGPPGLPHPSYPHPMHPPQSSKMNPSFYDPNYDFERHNAPMKNYPLSLPYSRAPSPNLLHHLDQNPQKVDDNVAPGTDAPDSQKSSSFISSNATNTTHQKDQQIPVTLPTGLDNTHSAPGTLLSKDGDAPATSVPVNSSS